LKTDTEILLPRLVSVGIAEHTELRTERRKRTSEALISQRYAAKGPTAAGFGYLDKYPALVLHYSEGAAAAAAAGAFLCISYRGKLLQHKLVPVQCTKKSTRVPVSPGPQYGYSV
jgi:hypothetical protein